MTFEPGTQQTAPRIGRGKNINNSCGVASLIMGSIACVAALVPCAGTIPAIVLSIGGLVLGLLGLILALSNKQSGLIFPILGMGSCAVAIVILLIWMVVMAAHVEKEQQRFQQTQSQLGR